jgi:hypothetical protein
MATTALCVVITNYAFTGQQQTYRYNLSDKNKNKKNIILLAIVNTNV